MAVKIICQNRKASYNYFIEETFEAGIVLAGPEVKSLRLGRANLKDSYARVIKGELFLINMHISPYSQADRFTQPDPMRARKLLVHKGELKSLIGKTNVEGYTLVATKVYFKRGKAKVEIGLAKGKKLHDKREAIKKKAVEMEMAKAMKRRRS